MTIQQVIRSTTAALVFVLPVQLLAQPAYMHPDSGYLFPAYLGSTDTKEFVRAEIEHYPDKNLGTRVSYKNGIAGCFADFYLYNHGHSRIPDGPESDVVLETFSESEANIFEYARRGVYDNLRRLTPPGEVTPKYFESPPFRMSIFEYEVSGELRVSWLLVTGSRQHFLKIRCTCLASESRQAIDATTRLITSFFEANKD